MIRRSEEVTHRGKKFQSFGKMPQEKKLLKSLKRKKRKKEKPVKKNDDQVKAINRENKYTYKNIQVKQRKIADRSNESEK